MRNQKKNGVILSYLSLITNVLIKFAYTPFLLRSLGQEEFGLYSLIITIIGYLTLLDLGFGSAIVRFTIKYRNEGNKDKLNELFGMMSILYFILGLIALLTCIAIYCNVDYLFGRSMSDIEISKLKIMILLSGTNLLFSFPLQIAPSILIAYEKFIFKNGLYLANIIIVPFFLVLFILLFNFKSVGLIFIVTIFNLIIYIIQYIYVYKKLNFRLSFKNFDKNLLLSVIGFSSSMFLLMVFEQIQFNSGQFVLGMFKGTKDVAIWGIAMVFVLNYRSMSTAITNVFIPSFISKFFENDESFMEKSIVKFVRIQSYVLLLTLCNFILFGYDFLTIWAGKEYQDAYHIALIIMVPMTISLIFDFAYIIQIAKNKFKFRIITFFLGFILSLILVNSFYDVSLKSYSYISAISIIIGQIVFMFFYLHYYIKLNLLKIFIQISKITILPIAFTIIFFLLKKMDLFVIVNNKIIELAVSMIFYNCCLLIIFWFFCFTFEERRIFKINRSTNKFY